MKILIKKGHLVDPKAQRNGIFDILLEDGIIKRVDKEIEDEADRLIPAEGKYVMPGFVDLHVHLREPGYEYKETVYTGTRAAARGGFTSICPMPNTNPVLDTKQAAEHFMEIVKKDAVVHVLPVGAVTMTQAGENLADIEGMALAGVAALSEDGKSVMNSSLYLEGMKAAKKAGIPVFAHCEDKTLVRGGVMNQGEKSFELNLPGICNAVEDIIAARDILLAKEAGVRLHLCHCSTKNSALFIRQAKESGLMISGEVCPHHFTLSDEDIPSDDASYKMNPPLRSKEDVQALRQGLKDGVFDVIATDHAPHGLEEKSKSMRNAPFGIVGLETAFALSYTELVKQGYLTLETLVEKLSCNPAKILGIEKGSLKEGMAADLVIADIDTKYTINAETFVSKGKNTPFDGREVYGKIEITIVDGEIVFDG